LVDRLLGLVMIVKNEAKIIERCLHYALPQVDCFTICDTGSEDETREIIWRLVKGREGQSIATGWTNFGAALNEAHEWAKGKTEWRLRLDADMVMHTTDEFRATLASVPDDVDALFVPIKDAGQDLWLPLLTRDSLDVNYVGPTHEYLDLTGKTWGRIDGINIVHLADGGMRPEKFERDIELLAEGVEEGDVRAIFYTAQSYFFLGDYDRALEFYERRMRMGGFEEERWYASYMAARIKRSVDALLACYRHRPWRQEPLLQAARIVSEDGCGDDVLFLEPLPTLDPRPGLVIRSAA
jgi:glycosyltransferase involved in cell wall biosynthesis